MNVKGEFSKEVKNLKDYIGFVIASYRVSKISEEFGFMDDGKEIQKLVKKKIVKKEK